MKLMMRNKKGQALLLVIVAMTVALALGVNVATRTLSTVSRTTRTDTSERVRMAAEGGVERVLNQPKSTLDKLADPAQASTQCSALNGTFNGTECVFTFNSTSSTEPIQDTARVTVTFNTISSDYRFKLERDSVSEVFLDNGVTTLTTCITQIDAAQGVDLYYIFYTTATHSILSKGCMTTGTVGGGYSPSGCVSPSTSDPANHTYCLSGMNTNSATGLRLHAIGGDARVRVTATSGTLPPQGHRITSIGELVQDGQIVSTKEVVVTKSYPFLPAAFDYGILSGNAFNY